MSIQQDLLHFKLKREREREQISSPEKNETEMSKDKLFQSISTRSTVRGLLTGVSVKKGSPAFH